MKKTFYCLRLPLRGGLHLGAGMDVYERSADLWQSDAIKSALYACLVKLFGAQSPNGEEWFSSFRISSAFPYQRGQLYFPKPRFSVIQWKSEKEEERIKNRKKNKKIEWLDQALFERALSGKPLMVQQTQLLGGKILSSQPLAENYPMPFGEELMERVTLSRWPGEGKNSTPFYFKRVHFQEDSGLYFLLETQETQLLESHLYPALRLLGDEGIGSDRSAGGAWFDFQVERHLASISLELPEKGHHWLGLGSYLPTAESWAKVDGNQSNWQWEKRGGYIASPSAPSALNLRKQGVYMLRTGAILHSTEEPKGKLVDLAPSVSLLPKERQAHVPDHPIWRDGSPIFLPFIPTPLH